MILLPKEKAKKLVEEFYNEIKYMERAKQCALIAVDEILNHHSQEQSLYRISDTYYWREVKKEIKKL